MLHIGQNRYFQSFSSLCPILLNKRCLMIDESTDVSVLKRLVV